jgi:hypothetical protein
LTGEALGTCASATVAAARKLSAKRSFRQAQQTHHFFCSLTPNLIFLPPVGQTDGVSSPPEVNGTLQLIPQSLLVPMRLHAFAAFVLGNFCLPSFFKGAHSDFVNWESIESLNSLQRKCSRRVGYLVSCDGPAAAFFLSCVPMPIFFRNGSMDCLRPRNFSIDSLTSRESPGS